MIFLRILYIFLIIYCILYIKYTDKIINVCRTIIWLEEVEEDSFRVWLARFLAVIGLIVSVYIFIKSFFI